MRCQRLVPFLLLAGCVVACAGCGGERAFVERLAVKAEAPMRFLASAPPASTAPGLGPAHMVFLSQRVGFLATTGGAYSQRTVGYIQPTTSGLIERTVDGGASWRVVVRAPQVVFEQITFADRLHGVAVGNVVHGSCCEYPPPEPVGYVTDDGGMHWRRLRLPAVLRGAALQLAAANAWYSTGSRLLFSADEGRTWTSRPLPAGASRSAPFAEAVSAFPTASVGYAAASASCGERLFKTTNGARSWTPLPGTCASSYSSIDFLDERTGWAVTGIPYDGNDTPFNEAGRLLIRFTDDGGASWMTVYRGPSWPVDTRLYFTDPRHGWAVSLETSQGFKHDSVHRTVNAGRVWRTVRYPLLPSTFTGPETAWAGEEAGGVLEHTTDGGRSWQPQVKPEYISPTSLLLATSRTLVVDGHTGALRSNDQGRSWVRTPSPSLRSVAQALHEPAYIHILNFHHMVAELSPDGGQAWRTLHVPWPIAFGNRKAHIEMMGDIAFTDAVHGLLASGRASGGEEAEFFEPQGAVPVFATHDAGATWKQLRVPRGVERDTPVTLGPGIVVINDAPLLYLSTDEGRHWASISIGNHYWECGVSRPQKQDIWLLCSLAATGRAVILLRSDDDGTTWRKLTGPASLFARDLIAINTQEAWATGQNLWHTTDGGNTWQEVWPNAPTPIPDDRSVGATQSATLSFSG